MEPNKNLLPLLAPYPKFKLVPLIRNTLEMFGFFLNLCHFIISIYIPSYKVLKMEGSAVKKNLQVLF